MAHYEGGSVCSQARSLWRLEPLRIRWRKKCSFTNTVVLSCGYWCPCLQLERQPHEVGAVFPYTPHHHRPVPVSGWRKGSVGGRPREGQHETVRFLLPRLKGVKECFKPLCCHVYCLSLLIFPSLLLSRRRWMWPRSVTWRGWAFQRSSMESPCASSSTCPQACGSHTQPWMPKLLVWEWWRERLEFTLI